MIQVPVLCAACARVTGANSCQAFPDRIPRAISLGGDDHRRARGDEVDGLVFEQADTDEARRWFAGWERLFALRQR